MILKDKTAVVYGAGGSLGAAVAKALSSAGARLFLTGRDRRSIENTAKEIQSNGGIAESEVVDAFDEKAIEAHLDAVIHKSGKLDISFNAVGVDVIQNISLVDIAVEDFVRPVTQTLQTRFLTASAAGKIMKRQGSGVILFLTATPGGIGYPYTAGFAAACAAVEAFSCNLAAELGIFGVRAVTIRSGGSPDSAVFKNALEQDPEGMKSVLHQMQQDTMLKKLPLTADIANAAVFLASDNARAITGVTIDLTVGTTAGLNYRASRLPPSNGAPVVS